MFIIQRRPVCCGMWCGVLFVILIVWSRQLTSRIRGFGVLWPWRSVVLVQNRWRIIFARVIVQWWGETATRKAIQNPTPKKVEIIYLQYWSYPQVWLARCFVIYGKVKQYMRAKRCCLFLYLTRAGQLRIRLAPYWIGCPSLSSGRSIWFVLYPHYVAGERCWLCHTAD